MSPLIQPQLLYVCQRLTFIKVSALHLSTYLIEYELSQKKCFIFFSGTKTMFVSRSVLKKKLCANFSEKKNITESNNLAPPPQKSNGASLTESNVCFMYVVNWGWWPLNDLDLGLCKWHQNFLNSVNAAKHFGQKLQTLSWNFYWSHICYISDCSTWLNPYIVPDVASVKKIVDSWIRIYCFNNRLTS